MCAICFAPHKLIMKMRYELKKKTTTTKLWDAQMTMRQQKPPSRFQCAKNKIRRKFIQNIEWLKLPYIRNQNTAA